MIKSMKALYPGKCSVSGQRINPGDSIKYDTVSRKAWLYVKGDTSNQYGNPQGVNKV